MFSSAKFCHFSPETVSFLKELLGQDFLFEATMNAITFVINCFPRDDRE